MFEYESDIALDKWIHIQGKQSCHLFFSFPLNWGQLMQERICSSRSNFFSLRVDPFGKVLSSYEANRKSQGLFPFAKNG